MKVKGRFLPKEVPASSQRSWPTLAIAFEVGEINLNLEEPDI
jgi:hypothetical protein